MKSEKCYVITLLTTHGLKLTTDNSHGGTTMDNRIAKPMASQVSVAGHYYPHRICLYRLYGHVYQTDDYRLDIP